MEKSEITLISGKKCALVHNKCNSYQEKHARREKSYTTKQAGFCDLAVALYNRYIINLQNFVPCFI